MNLLKCSFKTLKKYYTTINLLKCPFKTLKKNTLLPVQTDQRWILKKTFLASLPRQNRLWSSQKTAPNFDLEVFFSSQIDAYISNVN